MTEQEEDRLLRQALLDALRLDWEEVIEQAPPAAQSPKQEKRMRAMLADPVDYVRRVCRPLWKKVGRAVAGVFLTCTVTLGALMAASPTVRATVIRWVTEFYETYVMYLFNGEKSEEEMPRYTIGELPEGYEDTGSYVETRSRAKIIYENKEAQKIILRYIYMEQGDLLWVYDDDMEVHDVMINGMKGAVYISKDFDVSNAIIWVNDTEGMKFLIGAFADKETLLSMAKNTIKKE